MQQKKQPVEAVDTGPAIARLLGREAADLSGWYGDPVSEETVQTLMAILQYELRMRLCEGHGCFQLHVLLLSCHFWAGNSIGLEYEQLAASAVNDHERALLELVYGQLLISCKYNNAVEYLSRGFSFAVEYLDSADYFRIVRQHELLDYLPVFSTPSQPQGLNALLTEAGVIKHLRGCVGEKYSNTHRDTVG